MATIKDVAKFANVSIATVSHVINGTRFVREGTRKRVLRAIETLGYQPSALARGMVTKKSKTIAFLASDITNPFFAEVALGAESYARELGYNLFLCNADEEFGRSSSYLNLLREKRVDGVLDTSPTEVKPLSLTVPTVLFEKTSEGENCCSILIDTLNGAHRAVEHLVDLGHRRIAFISGPLKDQTNRNRLIGYERTLEDHGIPFDASLIAEGDCRPGSGYRATLKFLELPRPPTAIFASNDLMATGALCAAHSKGLGVPEDISVVGFDDIDLSRFTTPPLTTISFPKYEMGRMAMEILMNMIDGKGFKKLSIIKTELIIRQSTAPARRRIED
ncbi:MAG: LacI family DNA-binding transcriptional regulator [bacterium]